MKIQLFLKSCLVFFLFVKIASAQDVKQAVNHGDDHQQIFHAFTVEADVGEARDGSSKGFDLSGWVGGDYNRLWLKSEKKNYGNYEQKFEARHFTAEILPNSGMHKLAFLMILAQISIHKI
jgi:uncharacterized protein involved in copper resistance